MKVIIREEAVDDLDGIFAWVARDDPAAALELLRRIRERIERLATPGLSHMGRFGMVAGTRELVEAPYVIVYNVDEGRRQIVIVAVMHARRDRS